MPFDLADLNAARALVNAVVPPTPAITWPLLSAEVGAEVVVKHENHTPVGAFKVRGGLVLVDRLRRDRPHVTTLVSATTGNHGQSLAFAGSRAGLRVVIVVPEGNNPEKNAAMRALGAELIEHGHDFQTAREHAGTLADGKDAEFVPSYHPDLVLGVATYAAELFEDAADLDTVYVPIGMGSGCCGLIAVRDLLGLPTRIVGVVSDRADATARSFAAGRVVPSDSADTFAEGVACRTPDAGALDVLLHGAERVVAVPEQLTAEAMRLLWRTTHNVPEPAGAIALAGLLAERDRAAGSRVAVVLSGGNADTAVLREVLAGGTPAPPSARPR